MVSAHAVERETTPLTKTATIFGRLDESGQRHNSIKLDFMQPCGAGGVPYAFSQLAVQSLQEGAPRGRAALSNTGQRTISTESSRSHQRRSEKKRVPGSNEV